MEERVDGFDSFVLIFLVLRSLERLFSCWRADVCSLTLVVSWLRAEALLTPETSLAGEGTWMNALWSFTEWDKMMGLMDGAALMEGNSALMLVQSQFTIALA